MPQPIAGAFSCAKMFLNQNGKLILKPFITMVAILLFCSWIATDCLANGDQEPATKPNSEVDCTTLHGKVMCGYQGWFNCEGDGANLGWNHWARKDFEPFGPKNVTVDLWPDLSEYSPDERFATDFRNADGTPAKVFSSYNRKTVFRHFEWMRDYGIDGVFVQRFGQGLTNKRLLHHRNTVITNTRDAAIRTGRTFALMYDISGLRAGQVARLKADWKSVKEIVNPDPRSAYLHHNGKPIVAVWGIGFKDRDYSLEECHQLIKYLKDDGCTVMLGIPTGWRKLERDSVDDLKLHTIIKDADIISPWTVGRYRSPQQAKRHGEKILSPDLEWCKQHKVEFMPVAFPGFSWHNLYGEKLDAIPRLKGQFLWSQFVAIKKSGCKMAYVAMFDEVDEATAIFKCTNQPPTGKGVSFLTYEGLPSDHYLFLTGEGTKLIRGELDWTENMPKRRHVVDK